MKLFPSFSKQKPTPENKKSGLFQSRKKKKIKFQIPFTAITRFAWFTVGIFVILCVGASFFLPLIRSANALDYFDYVSELRSNILIAQSEKFTLKAYAVEKEYPYSPDGIPRDITKRAEIYFTAPSGDKTCQLAFSVNGTPYQGELSYDNIKAEYFFSVSADISSLKSLEFQIEYGDENLILTATTVKRETTLSPRQVLDKLRENDPNVFTELTSPDGFTGEIYIRLISESEPYYYIGLIPKDGEIQAYLLNSDTGKILATRKG